MTSLVYTCVAVAAAALATRAWLDDRHDPLRTAFLVFGWSLALAYLGFALSVLPWLPEARLLYLLAGGTVPATALWCVDRAFPRASGRRPGYVRRLALGTALVVPLTFLLHLLAYREVPRASPPEVVAGVFAGVAFALVLYRLWEAHEASGLRVEKARLRYLLAFSAGAILFTLAEQASRALGPVVVPGSLSVRDASVMLQGSVPPVSALLTGISVYFLYHTVARYRLLDLHELFSRFTTLAAVAGVLVVLTGITVLSAGARPPHPAHAGFQLFLATLVFLAAYDPLRDVLSWWSNRLLNQRGQQLAETLASLRQAIPTGISQEALTDRLLTGLHASGRVPVCSMYLWDPQHDDFRCVGHRGTPDKPPLARVAAQPFTEGFLSGDPWYLRSSLARRARTDATAKEILALLDAMHADLSLPFTSAGGVLGWLHLRDEAWSDGFSADEISRLAELAGMASVALSNIQDFQELEERNRLVALGQMAAGIAHEIRNPLAGLKGAAQFLQGEEVDEAAQEMLQIVVDEVNRLNLVVSQFLDYARPFKLQRETDHVNAIVSAALALVRAQGIPPEVTVVEDLAGDLPQLAVDGPKLSQVVLNLLQNALQAMPEGGILTVSTRRASERQHQGAVEIAVSDTGVGIEAGQLEKLFIPFYTTRQGGTGLGLPICHRIVDAHGGELDVQSRREPRETTFTVRLPPAEAESPPIRAETPAYH